MRGSLSGWRLAMQHEKAYKEEEEEEEAEEARQRVAYEVGVGYSLML